jgi:Flp pilus assembly protein TadB
MEVIAVNGEDPSPDYAPDEHEDEFRQRKIEDNIKAKSTWLRLLFMLLFMAIWAISRVVVGAVVVLQFLCVLFSGAPLPRLTRFGQHLATYTYQIVMYLTFNTQRRPYPFNEWPDGPPRE